VIVNGIRHHDSTATVSDDTGGRRAPADLRIGMVVEIEGSTDEAAGTGVARAIRVVSELLGPVGSIDRAAGRCTVPGVVVQASASTVWDDDARLAAVPDGLALGTVVQGFGARGPSGAAWQPDRIAIVAPAAVAESQAQVRIEGRLCRLAAGPRFELAGRALDATGANVRGGSATALRDGLRVRVTGAAAGGRIVARIVEIRGDEDPGANEGEVRGTVARVNGPGDFAVRDACGWPVVVSTALARFDDDAVLADLRPGVRGGGAWSAQHRAGHHPDPHRSLTDRQRHRPAGRRSPCTGGARAPHAGGSTSSGGATSTIVTSSTESDSAASECRSPAAR